MWADTLSATDFAVRSMYHTTLQATPRKLALVHYMILNTPLTSDWEDIRRARLPGVWHKKHT